MPTIPSIVAASFVQLLALCCFVLSLRGNYILYQNKIAPFMQKRNKKILFGTNISLMVLMVIMIFFVSVQLKEILSPLAHALLDVVACMTYYAFLFFAITQQWMLYFTQKWTYYTLQSQWQHIITASAKNTNWFIVNKHRYGSVSFMSTVFGIYHFCGAILGAISTITFFLHILHPTIASLLFGVPFLCSVIVYSILVCKTPGIAQVDDIFAIQWQSKMHSRLLLLMVIIIMIYTVLIELQSLIIDVIFYSFVLIGTYSLHHVSSYGIYWKNTKQSPLMSSLTNIMHSISVDSAAPKRNRIAVEDVLSVDDGINLLMLHLSKEISMEILLSFIEIEQYQRHVIDTLDKEDIQYDAYKEAIFAPNVQISEIVSSDESLKKKGYRIYKKYIEEESVWQININSEMKSNLSHIFNDLEALENNNSIKINDIFTQFEKVKAEMLMLMRFAFVRFQQLPQFEKVTLIFSDD